MEKGDARGDDTNSCPMPGQLYLDKAIHHAQRASKAWYSSSSSDGIATRIVVY